MKPALMESTALGALIGTYNHQRVGQSVVVDSDGNVRPMTAREDAAAARALMKSFEQTKEFAK